MAFDSNLVLATVTNASGSSNGSALDLLTGSERGPLMWARIEATTADITTNTVTLTFTIEHSSDNTNWYTHSSGADQVVTWPTGTAAVPTTDNIVWVPIASDKRYIRLAWAKSGAGTMANGSFTAYITNSHYH